MAIFKISYEEVHKDKIEYAIERYFATDIDELETLGFELETYYREILSPTLSLLGSPVLLLMRLAGSVIRVEFPLRASIYNPLVIDYKTGTYCDMMPGKYMRFMTPFTNGTLLITGNGLGTSAIPAKGYLRENCPDIKLTPALWEKHLERVAEYQAQGWQLDLPGNFKTFTRVMRHDNKAQMGIGG
jgi:hypothetical protein